MITNACLILSVLLNLSIDTDHFTFSYAQEDARLARHLSRKIEALREEVVSAIGYDFPDKMHVLLLGPDSSTDPGISSEVWIPPWAAAVARPADNLIALRVRGPRAGRTFDPEKTLTHELAHIVLEKATRHRPVPRWLSEGFAMFLAGQWGFSHTFALFKAALTGRVPPLADLDRGFSGPEGDIRLAYGLSFSFVSFLIGSYEKESIHLWIRLIGSGQPWDSAFSRAFPTTLTAAEMSWRKKLKIRYAWVPFIFSGTGLWFTLTLLFLLGYLSRRRRSQTTLERWRTEEGYTFPEGGEGQPPPEVPTIH